MSDELERLRRARDGAVGARGVDADRLARAAAALAEATRRELPEVELAALERERDAALADLRAAREAERAAIAAIDEEVGRLVAAPTERIDGLDARVPIALFPVRIETRFRRNGRGPDEQPGELLVRILPDGILAQTHEQLLTEAEVAAGEAYWSRVFDGSPEPDSWTLLLSEADVQRAAWIVERSTPLNLGDLPSDGDSPAPEFPPLQTRPPGWHRAPEAPLLPDRWILTAFRDGAEPRRVFSEPVREGLALTVRLSGDAPELAVDEAVDLSGDGLEIDPELRWAYDFDEAVDAGMAVRIPLDREELENGFTRILVLGVRTTAGADEGAAGLEALLDGHRFSRGLAFVAQGTQTNNSADAPSGYPAADPAGAASFAVARGAPLAGPGTDGRRFAEALGIDTATADHVAGADRDEQTTARAMADALWPATVGYFLTQLMAPEIPSSTGEALRAHMRERVRARGHYAAFRVGDVPYGLLPVGSLARWQASTKREDDPIAALLPDGLRRLAELWSGAQPDPPHIGRSPDADADLVETLAQDGSAQGARIRRCLGQDAVWNMLGFLGIGFPPWSTLRERVAERILASLGQPGWDPRVLHLSFGDDAFDFNGPLVQRPPTSEVDPLRFDYIAWLRSAAPDALREQLAPPTDEPLDALLYLMLRHALLAEYDASALELLEWRDLALPIERAESELVGVYAKQAPGRTAWERFDERIAGVTDGRALGEFLADPKSIDDAPAPQTRTVLEDVNAYRESLRALEGLPSAELERLFGETLDACSHRLDPWITALYAERVGAMRAERVRGTYVGCYGWVEHLVADPPAERVPVTGPGGERELARTDSRGYVYAPSMLHGATAAVLRSAHITRAGGEGDTYAVDISSRRVREALRLLDGVRDDQPLGAVLGYGFERGLHEGHPGQELDQFIDDFRGLYPLVANKAEDSGQAAETVSARNVVDGLRLRAAWRAAEIPWNSGGLTPSAEQRAAIEDELRRLDDNVDAVSDLLLAESVHQVLRGSTAGAAASLDSLAKGHRAPEPDVATTPRGGGVLHQRVALLVGDAVLPAHWQTIAPTPRAAASPELNAWLAGLLGGPNEIACTATPQGGAPQTVTLGALRMQPIDLLAAAAAADAVAPGADLDRRVARAALAAVADDVAVEIDYADPGPARFSLAVALELLAEFGRTLGLARTLEPRDLLPPERASALATADLMAGEIGGRADDAEHALAAAALALNTAEAAVRAAPAGTDPDLTDLRRALVRVANLGIVGAFPPGRHDDSGPAREALLTVADGAAASLAARTASVADATTPADRLQAVFGRGFPVLPRFVPADPGLLAPALADEPDLGAAAEATVESWFAQAARVRERLDPWRGVRIYGRALGADLPRPRIVQLPLERDGDGNPRRWAALDYDGGPPHRSGLCSLSLFGDLPAAGAPWSGLLVDEWPEVLPNREEDAGVVFHFDAPGAQAPQCVLLAVPPTTEARTWSYEALEDTLLETLELARMRALDLSSLGDYGQLLPMAYLAANPDNEAIATSFVGLLVAEATIERDGI